MPSWAWGFGLGAFSLSGFHLFGLRSQGVSVSFRVGGLFYTFVEAAVVIGYACISKSLEHPLPGQLVNVGLSEYKPTNNQILKSMKSMKIQNSLLLMFHYHYGRLDKSLNILLIIVIY